MKNYISACAIALCVAAAGCVGYESKTTVPTAGPSSTGVEALVGSWASVATANIIPSPSTCTDFKWTPSQQTATTAMGSFSATCAGDTKFTGSAMGTLTGSTIAWTANATGTTPSIPSCAISLSGTAELGVNSIRVPYSGTTCLGPVSGVEVLNKK
jgi:hypothetical protein